MVEAMHGSLTVTSTPGHGSTFTVALPAAPAPADMGRTGDQALTPATR
jgi:signal transduction histidine kinase